MLGFRRSSPHPHNLSDLDVIIGNGYLPQQLSSLITQISTPQLILLCNYVGTRGMAQQEQLEEQHSQRGRRKEQCSWLAAPV